MFEHVGILGHAFSEQGPLLEQLCLVLVGMLYQVDILRLHNVVFAPMAEEFNIGHKVDVGLPVTIFALLMLVDQVYDKS